jgi:hypothetical protein
MKRFEATALEENIHTFCKPRFKKRGKIALEQINCVMPSSNCSSIGGGKSVRIRLQMAGNKTCVAFLEEIQLSGHGESSAHSRICRQFPDQTASYREKGNHP